MLLDFQKIEEVLTLHARGGEKSVTFRTYQDEKNKIVIGRLVPGASIGYHRHETNSETLYVLEGQGKMIVENGEERLQKGSCHYCPQGASHSLVNDSNEDLIFFAVVPEHM